MNSPHPQALQRGILGVTLAVACFAALDTLTKLLAGLVPLAIVIWSRYLFLLLVTGGTQIPRRGRAAWHTRHLGLQLTRGLCLLMCSVFAFLSLRHMPVAEFTAVVMLTPLVITAAAAATLGESVSLWRWACVLGGFVGALVVIRPDADDFNWALLFPLGLVATNAAYQVLTSRLARANEDAGTMQLFTGLVGMGLSSLALPFVWQGMPPAWVCAVLAGVGAMGLLGHGFLIRAYSHAPASRLTPYLYLQIGFAMIGGWLMFGQVPDRWACIGVGLIAACGVAGTWLAARERAAAVRALADANAALSSTF